MTKLDCTNGIKSHQSLSWVYLSWLEIDSQFPSQKIKLLTLINIEQFFIIQANVEFRLEEVYSSSFPLLRSPSQEVQ